MTNENPPFLAELSEVSQNIVSRQVMEGAEWLLITNWSCSQMVECRFSRLKNQRDVNCKYLYFDSPCFKRSADLLNLSRLLPPRPTITIEDTSALVLDSFILLSFTLSIGIYYLIQWTILKLILGIIFPRYLLKPHLRLNWYYYCCCCYSH